MGMVVNQTSTKDIEDSGRAHNGTLLRSEHDRRGHDRNMGLLYDLAVHRCEAGIACATQQKRQARDIV